MTATATALPQPRTAAINEWDEGYKRLIVQGILRPKNRVPTPVEIAIFAEQVQRTGLDPFLKQIYGIYRFDSRVNAEVLQVQVAIDGFRLVAHRTRMYEGQDGPYWCGPDGKWKDVWLDDLPPAAAKVGVWRTGARAPIWGVARFKSYAPRTQAGKLMGLWQDMPENQIAKCAEAQALRKGFPNELSGLYTPDEMHQAVDAEARVTAAPAIEASAVTLITKARAKDLVDRAWSLDLNERLPLAVASVTGNDAGDCSTKGAATEALRALTGDQADEVEHWLSRALDQLTIDTPKETPDAA